MTLLGSIKLAGFVDKAIDAVDGILTGEAPESLMKLPKQKKTPMLTDYLHAKTANYTEPHKGSLGKGLGYGALGTLTGGALGAGAGSLIDMFIGDGRHDSAGRLGITGGLVGGITGGMHGGMDEDDASYFTRMPEDERRELLAQHMYGQKHPKTNITNAHPQLQRMSPALNRWLAGED